MSLSLEAPNYCLYTGVCLARGPKLLSMYTGWVSRQRPQTIVYVYRASLSPEAPNYCLCIQGESLPRDPKLLSMYTRCSLARDPKLLSMYTGWFSLEAPNYCLCIQVSLSLEAPNYCLCIQGESLARDPKLLSMYTVEQRGFLVRKYWQTGSFKSCQTAFRTEFWWKTCTIDVMHPEIG